MSQTATIANGQSLSADIDLRGQRLVGIIFPAAWTAANLSFQVADGSSATPGTYAEVFTDPGSGTGTVVALNAAAGQATFLTNKVIENCWLKVRSGPSGAPVAQGAARSLTLLTEPITK